MKIKLKLLLSLLSAIHGSMMISTQVLAQKRNTLEPEQISKRTQDIHAEAEKDFYFKIVEEVIRVTKDGDLINDKPSSVPGINHVKSDIIRKYQRKAIPNNQHRYVVSVKIDVDSTLFHNFYELLTVKYHRETELAESITSPYLLLPNCLISSINNINNKRVELIINRERTELEKKREEEQSNGDGNKSGRVDPIVTPRFLELSQYRHQAALLLRELRNVITKNSAKLSGMSWADYLAKEREKECTSYAEIIEYRRGMLVGIKRRL